MKEEKPKQKRKYQRKPKITGEGGVTPDLMRVHQAFKDNEEKRKFLETEQKEFEDLKRISEERVAKDIENMNNAVTFGELREKLEPLIEELTEKINKLETKTKEEEMLKRLSEEIQRENKVRNGV